MCTQQVEHIKRTCMRYAEQLFTWMVNTVQYALSNTVFEMRTLHPVRFRLFAPGAIMTPHVHSPADTHFMSGFGSLLVVIMVMAMNMPNLPTGTVTFLFTDIEGSTQLWERYPDQARSARPSRPDNRRHSGSAWRQSRAAPRRRGQPLCCLLLATDAVASAAAIQQALHSEPWPAPISLQVRLALHTGEADLREGDYYGSAVNRCARLRAVAHGGQALVSDATQELVSDSLPEGVTLHDLGEHRLKDLQRPERIFQLVAPGMPADFPPLKSLDNLPNNLPVQLTTFVGREREIEEVKHLLAPGSDEKGRGRFCCTSAERNAPAHADGSRRHR